MASRASTQIADLLAATCDRQINEAHVHGKVDSALGRHAPANKRSYLGGTRSPAVHRCSVCSGELMSAMAGAIPTLAPADVAASTTEHTTALRPHNRRLKKQRIFQ